MALIDQSQFAEMLQKLPVLRAPDGRPLTFQPSDQAAVRAILELTMPDGVEPDAMVDLTWGRGALWDGLNEYQPERYTGDFLDLPPAWTGRWRVAVWDPPHNCESGKNSRYVQRFDTGNASVQHRADITHLYPPFLREANRILCRGGVLLVKIGEGVHRARYRWQGFDFKRAVDEAEGLRACQVFVVPTLRSATLTGHNWQRQLHGRRGFVYWFVVRKGRC